MRQTGATYLFINVQKLVSGSVPTSVLVRIVRSLFILFLEHIRAHQTWLFLLQEETSEAQTQARGVKNKYFDFFYRNYNYLPLFSFFGQAQRVSPIDMNT